MENKLKFAFLSFIILLAFFLRLYKINAPLADWHSWRQADTAAVGRHYVEYGIDLLKPKYDDLSSIPSGLENPEGYRMVEFPILGGLQALVYKNVNLFNFEVTARLISIIFSLLTIVFLFLILDQLREPKLGLLTAFVYAVLPFNIYYNRVILPEPLMIASSLGCIYFFIAGVKEQKRNLKLKTMFFCFISEILLVISLLLKPFSLFIIVPPIAYIFIKEFIKSGQKIYWFMGLMIYSITALLLFVWWRWWISQFPEGIPANMWLLNGDGIRFKGAWFYWLFAERIGKLILGYWGVVFLGLGILGSTGKSGKFYYFWLGGILAYLAVVATGNVRHDYYQILIVPVVCIFAAKGILFLLTAAKQVFNRTICYLLFAVCFLFMEAFGWYQIRDFFNINHPEIVEAGRAVEILSQSKDKVIAPYSGDTAFLYQTNRKGWPIGGNIEDKIKKGAKYYVSVNFDEEGKYLTEKCQLMQERQKFFVINLQNCRFE